MPRYSQVRQAVARKSGYKQAAQARRLLADTHMPEHIERGTIALEKPLLKPEMRIKATKRYMTATIVVEPGETCILVQSEPYPNRAYLVVLRNGQWISSAMDVDDNKKIVTKASTIALEEVPPKSIIRCKALQKYQAGNVVVNPEHHFILVQSAYLPNRAFLVVKHNDKWVSSALDEDVNKAIVTRAVAYYDDMVAKAKATKAA